MTHISLQFTATSFATPTVGFGAVRSRIAAVLRDWRARRALMALDDAVLADIGVARSGIEDAVRHGRSRQPVQVAPSASGRPTGLPVSAFTEWR